MANWTIQQCRAVITGETAHRFLVHDRDAIYEPPSTADQIDAAAHTEDARAHTVGEANAFRERVIDRAECLDWLILFP